jgi:glutaredoxin
MSPPSSSSGTQTYTGGHTGLCDNSSSLSNFLLRLQPFKVGTNELFNTRFCPFGHFVTDFGHVDTVVSGTQTYTGGHTGLCDNSSSLSNFLLRLPAFPPCLVGRLNIELFNTRFCPFGHFETDFGQLHGFIGLPTHLPQQLPFL